MDLNEESITAIVGAFLVILRFVLKLKDTSSGETAVTRIKEAARKTVG